MNFNNVAIVSVKGSDYGIHFWYLSKDDVINITKILIFKKADHYNFFSLYVKISETTYYTKNRKKY